jgi:hypothetical protein
MEQSTAPRLRIDEPAFDDASRGARDAWLVEALLKQLA